MLNGILFNQLLGDRDMKTSNTPWTSGPREVLEHGLALLKKESDSNRRIAMIMIDNSVELMISTYLSLPKRVTGLAISRKKYQEISDSFPALLDAVEQYAPGKVDGINLGEIEWYHQIRNKLYHQGFGITVERDKVEVYAQLALTLFRALFEDSVEVPEPKGTELLGDFMACWVSIERTMYRLAELTYPERKEGQPINVEPIVSFLARDKTIDKSVASEIDQLRRIRNEVVHGMTDHKSVITADLMTRVQHVLTVLKEKLATLEDEQK